MSKEQNMVKATVTKPSQIQHYTKEEKLFIM